MKMNKAIAIDYGTKRTGIAITDELQIIASGLTTVATEELFDYLKKLFDKENISTVIVGKPLQMNGLPSESTEKIEAFITKFNLEFPDKKIVRIDERFTSKMAVASMVASGMKKSKRKDKAMIDEIAATIILQDYLLRKTIA
jgi:putative holliday junction resolvase